MKKRLIIIAFFTYIVLILTSCTTKQTLDSKESVQHTDFSDIYQNTSVTIKTLFDLTDSDTNIQDGSNFTLHILCPKDWKADNGIYSSNEELSMVASQTIVKINPNTKLDKNAFKYFQRGDSYDYSDRECIISKTNNGTPYVFYKDESYCGTLIIKFEDIYMCNIQIGEPLDYKTFQDMINSINLEQK